MPSSTERADSLIPEKYKSGMKEMSDMGEQISKIKAELRKYIVLAKNCTKILKFQENAKTVTQELSKFDEGLKNHFIKMKNKKEEEILKLKNDVILGLPKEILNDLKSKNARDDVLSGILSQIIGENFKGTKGITSMFSSILDKVCVKYMNIGKESASSAVKGESLPSLIEEDHKIKELVEKLNEKDKEFGNLRSKYEDTIKGIKQRNMDKLTKLKNDIKNLQIIAKKVEKGEVEIEMQKINEFKQNAIKTTQQYCKKLSGSTSVKPDNKTIEL